MHRLLFLFLLFVHLQGCGQNSTLLQPQVSVHRHQLGNRLMEVTVSRYDTASFPVFVHLHDNEQTAQDAAHQFLQRTGGIFISIENRGERLIEFACGDRTFTFDPNRMFTPGGIAHSLALYSAFDTAAACAVQAFAGFVVQLLPSAPVLIALHNNTNENYSLTTYQTDSASARDAAALHINPAMDADDFIFTTDSSIYVSLKEKNLNVVLQNNETVTDDGSLSVYWARQGKPYINIEAEHGHLQQQLDLLEQVFAVVKETAVLPQ